MALVHIIRVVQNYPQLGDGFPEQATIDLMIDNMYIRVGYLMSELTSADVVKEKLINDLSVITNSQKQSSFEFPFPIGGIDRPDLIPEDFNV